MYFSVVKNYWAVILYRRFDVYDGPLIDYGLDSYYIQTIKNKNKKINVLVKFIMSKDFLLKILRDWDKGTMDGACVISDLYSLKRKLISL